MLKRSLLTALVLSTNLLLAGCADDQARSQIADTNIKLSQLQDNMGTLDKQVSNQKLLDILNRLDDLQSQINEINGNVSTLKHNQDNYHDNTDQLYQSIDQRLTTLEKAAGVISKPQASGVVAAVAPVVTTQTPKTENSAELKTAIKKIKAHDLNGAIHDLRNIIKTSDSDLNKAKARYYLSVAYAANGQYKDALITARNFATDYPQSADVPDAMRVMYISQIQLGMKKSAAKTASSLQTKYPNSDANKKVQADLNQSN